MDKMFYITAVTGTVNAIISRGWEKTANISELQYQYCTLGFSRGRLRMYISRLQTFALFVVWIFDGA